MKIEKCPFCGSEAEPLFGHRSGKHNNTHWMAFMKIPKMEEGDAE